MTNHTHTDHQHSESCGHLRISHNGHVDYLHDGHLHHGSENAYEEHVLEVTAANPDVCRKVDCDRDHASEGDESIPHGNHVDYLFYGKLHHHHNDHCDDHGQVTLM